MISGLRKSAPVMQGFESWNASGIMKIIFSLLKNMHLTVVVVKDKKILLQESEKGLLSLPGGCKHGYSGEDPLATAARLVQEQSGVVCQNLKTLVSKGDLLGFQAGYVSRQDDQNPPTIKQVVDWYGEGKLRWDWYDPEKALEAMAAEPDRIVLKKYVEE